MKSNVLFKIPTTETFIIQESLSMKKALEEAILLSKYKIPVLITGETGTGKGLFAGAIHYSGENNLKKDFVRVDCGAINSNLALSELFGHVKGAFTGADKDKIGFFKLVENGTIFLDEIGNQDEIFQRNLLSVVETGEFRPVGKANGVPEKTNLRIIAATNINLEEAMDKGKFRKDLFYRLEKGYINLTPLRDRKEEIPLFLDSPLGLTP